MYAVVKTGGKQYRVTEGDTLKVEKLPGEPGQPVVLDQVLLLVNGEQMSLGRPLVAGAQVTAEILEQDRHRKVIIYKYRRRKRYRRKNGHRQPYTALRITGIQGSV
ncbi:MAG: 50S ribosomal protein L21 [Deltaproteobacteria bacterium]|nr:50S ribosomal protein L21 [Deltaproteobacteria bacterium]